MWLFQAFFSLISHIIYILFLKMHLCLRGFCGWIKWQIYLTRMLFIKDDIKHMESIEWTCGMMSQFNGQQNGLLPFLLPSLLIWPSQGRPKDRFTLPLFTIVQHGSFPTHFLNPSHKPHFWWIAHIPQLSSQSLSISHKWIRQSLFTPSLAFLPNVSLVWCSSCDFISWD